MPPQTERAFAHVTAETLAVEEVSLSAEPLHHVHPLGAEVTDVTAPQSSPQVLAHHTLKTTDKERTHTHTFVSVFGIFL